MQEKAHHDVRMHALLIYRCVCTRVAHAEQGGRGLAAKRPRLIRKLDATGPSSRCYARNGFVFRTGKKKFHLQLRSCRKRDN